ncbi:MAG TPA: hypothetical protein DCG49_05580 [Ruminococcus sp.]|nr:hypothetical protein [Ruminococcus sp.]
MSNVGLKIAGVVGVVAVLGGGCAAAYAFSDTVKNQVKLATSSPEDYFHWVYDKNVADLADGSAAAYQKGLDRTNGSAATHCELRFTPSEDCKSLVLEQIGADDSGETGKRISDIVNNMNTVVLSADAAGGGNGLSEQFKLLVNDTEVTSAEAAADLEGQSIYMRVPELSERWINMPLDLGESGSTFDFAMNPGAYLSASDLSGLISKYCLLPVQDLQTVTVEKKQSVNIGAISTEYTAMTVDLTLDDVVNIVSKITDAASTDETLLKLAPDQDAFTAALVDIGENIRTAAENVDSTETVKFTTYVDATGTIRGFYVAPDQQNSFFAGVGMQDGQLAASVQLSALGTDYIKMSAKSDTSGNGDFKCTLDDLSFSGTFSDLHISNPEKGYVTGNLTINYEDYEAIPVTFSEDGNGQKITYELNLEGTDYGSLELYYSMNSDLAPIEPDKSSALEVKDNDFNVMDYTNQDDLTEYVTTVLTRLGLDEEDAKSVGMSVGAMFFMYY